MITQALEQATRIAPNTYLIILLALFIAEKVISMTFKGIAFLRKVNGEKKKDDTQRIPCLQNPTFTGPWETHKQEAHDTKVISDRLDRNMSKLLKESLLQTVELVKQTQESEKQTRVLERIRDNGSKK